MLWLAVHPPRLSLEAFAATLGEAQRGRPVALVADHRITAVDEAAHRCGVQPGHRRATALALAADLVLGQADAARDAAALRSLAHVALGFTPAVTIEGGHSVLLEVRASLRLFGGLASLRARLGAALAPLGHAVHIAAAPTPLGAALLARWRDDLADGPHLDDAQAFEHLLGAVPVWLLGPGREHWEALQGMGLHTLADLRALPRSGLARRFGEGLLDDLDRALGRRADPRRWLTLPATFDSRLELFARADTTDQVLAGAAVLLARLVAWAGARQARVGAFTLRMAHEPRHREGAGVPAATELAIALAEPSLDAAHLQTLLRERLARCPLPAPTLELQIACRHLVQAPPPNGELFPSRQGEAEGLVRLIERLRARLGEAAVRRLQPRADHRPEQGAQTAPVAMPPPAGPSTTSSLRPGARRTVSPAGPGAPSPASSVAGTDLALPLHRPVWLLPQPQPLAEAQAQPLLDGRPLHLLGGPERIEAGWWDGDLAARDYFIAQAGDGSLVWVYRVRLPRLDAGSGWFLHGRFA